MRVLAQVTARDGSVDRVKRLLVVAELKLLLGQFDHGWEPAGDSAELVRRNAIPTAGS